MPQYLAPGVYVEEVSSGNKPIAGVGTSTAGFIGVVSSKLTYQQPAVTKQLVGIGDGNNNTFRLRNYLGGKITVKDSTLSVYVGEGTAKGKLNNNTNEKITELVLEGEEAVPEDDVEVRISYVPELTIEPPEEDEPAQLCTNFSEFVKYFGDFNSDSESEGHNQLAHSVYGFFNNGGTRCWVARIAKDNDIQKALAKFEEIDEIALVACPGVTSVAAQSAVITHCEKEVLQDRFAILDSPPPPLETINKASIQQDGVPDSSYAAIYFPWIQVFDPASGGTISVPPSGHIAGVYARVDATRGVFKAPANEVIRGALGVDKVVTKAIQAGLDPEGINAIRKFDGTIKIWGARTLAANQDNEWKYINVRRLFLFLRESIDQGTQWVVFEPNDRALWAKITRNITAFLTNVWRDGALVGSTPKEAFYVKCDDETNTQADIDLGKVTTEIGVAVTKPAEFVIFRISQWSGPGN